MLDMRRKRFARAMSKFSLQACSSIKPLMTEASSSSLYAYFRLTEMFSSEPVSSNPLQYPFSTADLLPP